MIGLSLSLSRKPLQRKGIAHRRERERRGKKKRKERKACPLAFPVECTALVPPPFPHTHTLLPPLLVVFARSTPSSVSFSSSAPVAAPPSPLSMASLLPLLLLSCCCSSFLGGSLGPALAAETSDAFLLLTKIKPALQGGAAAAAENIQLSSWNASVPLCQWRGLEWARPDGSPLGCDEPAARTNLSLVGDPSIQLTALRLPAAGLSGTVPREIGELSSLRSLLLGVNSLAGSVPLELGNCPALADIDLSGNSVAGALPPSIWNLCGGLVSLRLHGNNLSGAPPEPAVPGTSCERLRVVDLGGNRLQGGFPGFLTEFHGLQELDLSSNLFSGAIPDSLGALENLETLNLSHNSFTGTLPSFQGGAKFGADAFAGNNPGLCGPPLGECGGAEPGMATRTRLRSGVVAGIVIGLMAGLVVAASLFIGWVQGRRRNRGGKAAEEDGEVGGGTDEGTGEGKLVVFQGGEHLTLEDVLNATGQVMEKTVYGTVYKAKLADGGTIALRLLREGSCVDRASCLPVIRQLGRARHENLVSLRAFYQGKRGEKLLIYDYLPNRTLHDLLHGETRVGKPMLNWARRHKIALGIARGIAYLHTGQETPVAHGSLRSRSVLVDEFFVSRLTEYGLNKLMVPAVADEMFAAAKADGYKAPELHKMKRCCPRTDVYSFGILLLEILMGKKPGKDPRTGEAVDLPALVKAAVLEETTMEVFDVEVLKGVRPTEDGLVQALKLAMGCCAPVAAVRPDMSEVVKQLEENRPRNRSALYSPADTRSEIGTPF